MDDKQHTLLIIMGGRYLSGESTYVFKSNRNRYLDLTGPNKNGLYFISKYPTVKQVIHEGSFSRMQFSFDSFEESMEFVQQWQKEQN